MRGYWTLLALVPGWGTAQLVYRIEPNVSARSLHVAIEVESPGSNPVFRIPAWCPGFYFLQKYPSKISSVKATTESGASLEVTRPDGNAWKVRNPSNGSVTFSYAVLGDDNGLGFFGVNVLPHTAFVNGPAALMYLEGRKEEVCQLHIKQPKGWEVATSMVKSDDGTYQSSDYDELIDHPIQIGKFERRSFLVDGVAFDVVFVSQNQQYRPDLDEETALIASLSAPVIRLFGGAPFKRYLYLIHLEVGDFEGGLEHRASNVIATDNRKPLGIESLLVHEFVHAWNVKQFRPLPLGPFDYTKPVRTGDLWFAEGVTDYYAKILTFRSGVFGEEWLLSELGDQIVTLQHASNRFKLTLEDCSRRAWENGGMGVGDLSYYNKGLVAGFLLDAAIRSSTGGKKSLDNVLRNLFSRYRLPKPGYEEDALRLEINSVAGSDLTDVYKTLIRTTQEVPYDLLKGIGFRVPLPGQERRTVGLELEGTRIVRIDPRLAQFGIRVGDSLERVNGNATAPGIFAGVGDRYRAELTIDGKPVELDLPVLVDRSRSWQLEYDPFATAQSIRLRESFLSR